MPIAFAEALTFGASFDSLLTFPLLTLAGLAIWWALKIPFPAVFSAMTLPRKILLCTVVLLATVAYSLDIADRFGTFGPTRAELEKRLTEAELKRERLQNEADYRRVGIETLLGGKFFTIPPGYPFAGEQAAVSPLRFVVIPRKGPCLRADRSKLNVKGKFVCDGHEIGFDLSHGSTVNAGEIGMGR